MAPLALSAALRLDFAAGPAVDGSGRLRAVSKMGDQALVERAQRGEEAAFRELYAAHRKQVVSQLSYLVPRADLEDALQEVFIEVFRSVRKFEGRSAFTTWLYRLVVHVAMKSRRKAARRGADLHLAEVPEAADPSPGPGEVALTAERLARAEALLERLSPKKRTVLVLHDLRGMEAARIAEMTGTNILTVRTRLFYARREFEQLAQADPALSELFAPPKESP
ncbi:MAG: sigma-70 family RNA polymerase sigma factor [Myxococcales bacterium]|nr:sigma-70 family RNA polymerase sigma factor [Myxococcales bacterium]